MSVRAYYMWYVLYSSQGTNNISFEFDYLLWASGGRVNVILLVVVEGVVILVQIVSILILQLHSICRTMNFTFRKIELVIRPIQNTSIVFLSYSLAT